MINYKKKSFTLADIYSFQIFYHQTPVKSAHSSSKAKISKKNKRKIDRYAVKCGEKKRKNGIDREASSPTRFLTAQFRIL